MSEGVQGFSELGVLLTPRGRACLAWGVPVMAEFLDLLSARAHLRRGRFVHLFHVRLNPAAEEGTQAALYATAVDSDFLLRARGVRSPQLHRVLYRVLAAQVFVDLLLVEAWGLDSEQRWPTREATPFLHALARVHCDDDAETLDRFRLSDLVAWRDTAPS